MSRKLPDWMGQSQQVTGNDAMKDAIAGTGLPHARKATGLTADEAEHVLQAFIANEQQRFLAVLTPYVEELGRIAMRRTPRNTPLPDGRVMRYVGPTAEDILGAYKAPAWLEKMCDDVGPMQHYLRRRRGN